MNYFYLISISFFIFSCSSVTPITAGKISLGVVEYSYQDNSGVYKLKRTIKENKVRLIVIEEMFDQNLKLTQKEILVSQKGSLAKKITLLRPMASQFHVWFSGKKYVSQVNLNLAEKRYDLVTSEGMKKNYPLDSGVKGICFLSTIVECAQISGFIKKSIELQSGSFNLMLILNGYPYWQEMYPRVDSELVSSASFVYEAEVKEKQAYRFSLNFSGQSITYLVDHQGNLLQKFWIAESLSMVKKGDRILSEEELLN